MSAVEVDGAVLATELSDEGGTPVVQLHGLTSSRRRDRALGLDLGRGLHGTRLLRYDARAHGESTGRPVPEDYRWPVLAEDLLAVLERTFPGEPVHGVGQSMGAATLLHAALREPDRFSGLTLMAPPTAWATRARRAKNYLKLADLVQERGLSVVDALDRAAVPVPALARRPHTAPDVSAALLPSVYRGAAASDLPPLAELATVQVPVSLLAWTEDVAHPMATATALSRTLPRARLVVASTPEEVAAWPEVLAADVAATGA